MKENEMSPREFDEADWSIVNKPIEIAVNIT